MSKLSTTLFSLLIIGFILLFAGTRIESISFTSPWGFFVVLIISPLLLISSIYELKNTPKKWIFPVIGILISLTGIILSIGLIIALRNFT